METGRLGDLPRGTWLLWSLALPDLLTPALSGALGTTLLNIRKRVEGLGYYF